MSFPQKYIWTFLFTMLAVAVIMGVIGWLTDNVVIVLISLAVTLILAIVGTITPAPPMED